MAVITFLLAILLDGTAFLFMASQVARFHRNAVGRRSLLHLADVLPSPGVYRLCGLRLMTVAIGTKLGRPVALEAGRRALLTPSSETPCAAPGP